MRHEQATFIGHADTPLFFQRWLPEGTPRALILIVHGFGEHSDRYPHVVSHFVPHGYLVCGYDQRGFGRSPGKRGLILSWDEHRNDLEAMIRQVQSRHVGTPLFLYAHSMGGLIALEYALRSPGGLQGIVASAPVLGPPAVSPILLALSQLLTVLTPRLTLNAGLDASGLSRDSEVVRAYVEDPLVHGQASARLGGELMAKTKWVQTHAPDLRLPLLIIHGGADRISPPQDSQRFYEHAGSPDKTRLLYPDGFHELHNDIEHARVMADVEAWIERRL
jgi:alpha-beta hydrolase superfamily lysophospholipase